MHELGVGRFARRHALRGLISAVLLFAAGCAPPPAERNLDELVLRDSTYFDPGTMQPYSGRVVRMFPDDPEMRQLEATMLDGTWHGELRVYHANGRIRYLGSLANGEQCGEWIQNRDPDPPGSLYDELRREIESLSIFPPCPPQR
jgi:hypothetical protein